MHHVCAARIIPSSYLGCQSAWNGMNESSGTLSANSISDMAVGDSYCAHSLTWYQNALSQHSDIQLPHRTSFHCHPQRRFVKAKARREVCVYSSFYSSLTKSHAVDSLGLELEIELSGKRQKSSAPLLPIWSRSFESLRILSRSDEMQSHRADEEGATTRAVQTPSDWIERGNWPTQQSWAADSSS